MVTLNFPNGMVQTYPNDHAMQSAVRAMGGDYQWVAQDIYVFIPKK